MRTGNRVARRSYSRMVSGFSFTEMLVTMLILALASTLMATGIPVAADTYRKVVNSANAQLALSTTITVLRSEFGSSTKLEKKDGDKNIYYRCSEGSWAIVSNATPGEGNGLIKRFYSETPEGGVGEAIKSKDEEGNAKPVTYPLISSAAVTDPLKVSVESIDKKATEDKTEDNIIVVKKLSVEDGSGNELASVDEFEILVPFAK